LILLQAAARRDFALGNRFRKPACGAASGELLQNLHPKILFEIGKMPFIRRQTAAGIKGMIEL